MDWKKTFSRGQWVIHGIFTLAFLISLGATVFALRLNHIQSSSEERIQRINTLLNGMGKDKAFAKLAKFLSWAEANKANDKMGDFTRKLAETEELLEIKASEELTSAVKNFNKLINRNSGMSNPAEVLKVLGLKVDQLYDVAQSQNYRNVGIISKRMKSRLEKLTEKNVGRSVQVSYLASDLNRLDQIVSRSTLDEGEKVALLNRIKGMGDEIGLLTSLSAHTMELKNHVDVAEVALSNWLTEARKKAADFKGSIIRKQKLLVLTLAGQVGFVITAWCGLLYLFRWQKIRIEEQMENEVKAVIEKGVLADQRFMMDHYSEQTRNDIIALLDGLKVKLNLGTMLHEGLPFAGCMLDNTFKVTWFNQLFLDQFYLSEEEVRSDAFNWDHLRERLNLDTDPAYEALVNKSGGIYPVKLKQDELTPMRPYEMYVTPMNVNREDRVMIFFYPLVAVKEAIDEQVNLAREGILRFVELWEDGLLNENELKFLEKDFMLNDLAALFERLTWLYERLEKEKQEYLLTISRLEKENQGCHQVISGLQAIEEERKEIIRGEFSLAAELKQSFLTTLEKSESLININRTVLQQNDELKTGAQRMHQISLEGAKKARETSEIMGQLEGVRTDYKKLKLELLEVKAKLISLNTSLMGQLPPLDEHQQKLSLRHKDELARLDFNVCTLDKKLSQLDVLLMKLQMMHEKNQHEQTNFNFLTSQKDHETREALVEIQRTLNAEESRIVEHFTSLHKLMKQDLGKSNEARAASTPGTETYLS